MTSPGTVSIIWANGEDNFCILKLGALMDLEEKCGAPFSVIAARLENGHWGVKDVRETIRLGLIGGGMDPKEALNAVRNHVDNNPNGLAPSVLVAYEVVKAAMFGAPKDDIIGDEEAPSEGKKEAAQPEGTASTTQMEGCDALG